ncbi:MAG: HDOD domain-containing protein [Spirochaetaceae bacterium]|jgi:putative nucleotidyltransferase with HDIG domain|nr:HDOD domain-containing protein [Spirochaetaceae bacterium]
MDELNYVVNEASIKKAVQTGVPLNITTYTLPHDIEVKIEQTVAAFLRAAGQEKIKDYVTYCVSELAVNAKKANTKRVYFQEKGLDLGRPDDYKTGMLTFKKETMEHLAHYLQLQKDQNLYIKINMYYKANSLQFEVRNNVRITRIEQVRIHEKLSRSRQYNSMEDAFAQIIDDSEGAGLGLVVIVLMLKKMGLGEECFEITDEGKETIARLTIPVDGRQINNITDLTNAIVENINALPQFPQNIINVQRLANDPKSDMADIARMISTDPAMTADILKLVNSAQYMLAKKVNNIAEAATILGLKGIKNLLYSYGTQKILGDDSGDQKALWEHSYKTAFYAYNIVKNFGKDKSVLDDVYVGGILHDMGKIVFSRASSDVINNAKSFCKLHAIPETTFENVTAGMNHAEIGAHIADKWNFPEVVTAAIRFHHDPLAAPVQYRSLVFAVYMANMLTLVEEKEATIEQFESAVLASFGISNKKQIDMILEKFSAGFKASMRGI